MRAAQVTGQVGRGSRPRVRGVLAGAVLAVTFGSVPANAVAGRVDTSFAGTGTVASVHLPYTADAAHAVVTSANTVTMVGSRENEDTGERSGMILRYLPDGSPDPAFGGGDGLITLSMGGPTALYDGALLADGRLVVVGQVNSDFGVAVLSTAGVPDPAFSGDGVASLPVGTSFAIAYGVVIDGQGRIVVVGRAQSPDFLVMAIARFEADGDLDPTFSDDGVLTVPFRGGGVGYDVAMRGSRIVVVGSANGFGRFGIVRLLDDGSLDATFSDDGKTTSKGSPYVTAEASGVAIQSDGRIVVAGGSHEFVVARYTPRGRPDATFSDDGYARGFPEDLEVIARDVVVQPSGRIVAVGGDTGTDLAVARFRANGSLDPSFSDDGRIYRRKSFDGFGVAIDQDGRLLVAGGWFSMMCSRYLLA